MSAILRGLSDDKVYWNITSRGLLGAKQKKEGGVIEVSLHVFGSRKGPGLPSTSYQRARESEMVVGPLPLGLRF